MATKSTSAKKAAPAKKAKSDAKAPKAAKAVKKPVGPNELLPVVRVTVTYQVGDNTTAEFTIESSKLHDKDFQRKLEKFISDASDSKVFVAANGEWSPKPQD